MGMILTVFGEKMGVSQIIKVTCRHLTLFGNLHTKLCVDTLDFDEELFYL